jgi:hypothetical protein
MNEQTNKRASPDPLGGTGGKWMRRRGREGGRGGKKEAGEKENGRPKESAGFPLGV